MDAEGAGQVVYDVIIVGGGPAGLSAAMYARRYNMRTLVIAKDYGLAADAPAIENYPGFISISGGDLVRKFMEHAEYYGAEIEMDEVIEVRKKDNLFEVIASDTYYARSVIFAMGSRRRTLDIPGEAEFRGRGVSYCATCDAPLFRNRVVAVVGGSDAACVSALHLAEFASKVYQIYRRDKLRGEPINVKRVLENEKIEVIYNAVPVEIVGDMRVKGIKVRFKDGGEKLIEVDGIFVEIGSIPNSEIAKKLGVAVDEEGHIIVDSGMRTNIPGVFAAGDITTGSEKFEQIVTAVAEGALAARSAYDYVRSNV